MDKKLEYRVFPVELRAKRSDDDEPPVIEGHAAVFNSLSEELWGFREQIAPGAFEESIKQDDVRALFNHDPNYVLGRNTAGTLELKEDDKGLYFRAKPPDTQWAKDLMVSMERGDISQCSFGFIVQKDRWDHSDPDNVVRTLEQVRLFDVSVVTYPAYPQTDAQVRTAKEVFEAHVAEARARDGDEEIEVQRALELRRKRLELAAKEITKEEIDDG